MYCLNLKLRSCCAGWICSRAGTEAAQGVGRGKQDHRKYHSSDCAVHVGTAMHLSAALNKLVALAPFSIAMQTLLTVASTLVVASGVDVHVLL